MISHRYAADTFYGGGQWPVLAALLARHHTRVGNPGRAAQLLDWIVRTADSDLLLPEQVSPLLAPDVLDEWLERWGPSVDPLLWSHGAFLAGVVAASGSWRGWSVEPHELAGADMRIIPTSYAATSEPGMEAESERASPPSAVRGRGWANRAQSR